MPHPKFLALFAAILGAQATTATPVNIDVFELAETSIGTKAQFEAGSVSWFWSSSQGVPLDTVQQKRQSGQYITNTHLVGDGNPHQNRKVQQVTQKSICPGEECSASKTDSTTVGYSVNIGGSYSWINGGFSVSESKTDGETHACPNSGHDTVCVWRSYEVTAYTVADTTCYYFNGASSMCSGDSNQRVIYSPNDCQNDSPYLCKYDGDCQSKEDSYLITDGPAGGPPC
ncbi:hypothetical protein E4T42_03323 [Aureobasidium subglaciale]|uniref:Ig-like domain-containing protein n=1 Tax=Aureobasidium subglaciale (strain EXF-2481) TaxID=1043005 RepID=A0A074YVQ3_AURSE|nr:uncharacterized protein AUEXF2481DRAFT_518547 [Aureobasidium subglaciale EXF-2481]KAI5212761.1 hypothetical protein E4T38_00304 [Aureobasidium subglaciale]KAI5232408.1 hypothetical protein E4T40_00303 [Aureobasidium subglaciale]KAI5234691.1 hypothetical protein E4T41_00303 [Aureobasidium subglaciale]KAI5252636.1 hypothetical protein E4T42_03323 [Aureobasidium subglaciale]KAI5268342.1 hypothetical protein E4T46_00303 [Aureobasidium subglaciale]